MSRKLPDSMHWQIYQAYLRGPSALFRLFEDAFGRLALWFFDPRLGASLHAIK